MTFSFDTTPVRYAVAAVLIALTGAVAPYAPAEANPANAGPKTDTKKRVEKPRRLSAEAEHMAKLDAILKPLVSYGPSDDDIKRMKDAIAAVRANDEINYIERKAAISDPVGRKLVEWIRLRAGTGSAEDYRNWLSENPDWPTRSTMIERMEEALFENGASAATIKSYFAKSEPETGPGVAALASAYLAEGNKAEASKLASKAWREFDFPASLEAGFLTRFAGVIDESDHKWRFDRLLTDDVRWKANRKTRSATAKRIIPLLSQGEQKAANARLAVFNKSSKAGALIKALPSKDATDWGLVFHRAQLLRRASKTDAAAKLILSAPTDPKKIPELDEWWAERRELAYDALKEGNPKLAYRLAKDAGPLTVNPLNEQRFMAGWIALRYLNDKNAADQHFKLFAKSADGPLSRAKAAYWLGRVAEARGNKEAAAKHYRAATKDRDTFHALLSMQKLEPGRTHLKLPMPALPTPEEARTFNNFDLARAAVLTHKAGLSRHYTRIFLVGLRNALTSEANSGMIAHLAEALDDTQMAVRTAKSAVARGQNLYLYAYPVHPFPAYTPLRTPPETALLLAIARQETEFEHQTVSGAGAKGLLQVMTVTAKHVCHDYKIKCQIKQLTADKSYNAMIASAYIADRMEDFSGSYVLGFAGYNAGPGRARQWIRENGDPRDPNVDIIDWIERIPISETRNYVTKVLSNVQIYRARLGDKAPLRLEQDLQRARSGAAGGSSRREPDTASN